MVSKFTKWGKSRSVNKVEGHKYLGILAYMPKPWRNPFKTRRRWSKQNFSEIPGILWDQNRMQRMSLHYGSGISRMVEGQLKRVERKTRNVSTIYRFHELDGHVDRLFELINLDHLLCQGQVSHIGSRKWQITMRTRADFMYKKLSQRWIRSLCKHHEAGDQ